MAELFETCPRFADKTQPCCGREIQQVAETVIETSQLNIHETSTGHTFEVPVYELKEITQDEKGWVAKFVEGRTVGWVIMSNPELDRNKINEKFPILKEVRVSYLPD